MIVRYNSVYVCANACTHMVKMTCGTIVYGGIFAVVKVICGTKAFQLLTVWCSGLKRFT